MSNLIIENNLLNDLRRIISEARNSVVRNINTEMLKTYWEIGRRIVEEEQKGKLKAQYGSSLMRNLSKELTKEFGKGFSTSNLFSMRKFYIDNQIFQTVSGKLSWSHQLLLLSISDLNARSFYQHECENSNWSVRELNRQIVSLLYFHQISNKLYFTYENHNYPSW